jgi:hypothetical protein
MNNAWNTLNVNMIVNICFLYTNMYLLADVGNSHMAVLFWATGLFLLWPFRGEAAPLFLALAECGKQPFGAPLDGGLSVFTLATSLAPADVRTTTEATPQSHNRNYTTYSADFIVSSA